MKIVKEGRKSQEPWVGRTLNCLDCNCGFLLEDGDKVKLVPDPREGDYYELKCPNCKAIITIAVELFNRLIIS